MNNVTPRVSPFNNLDPAKKAKLVGGCLVASLIILLQIAFWSLATAALWKIVFGG